MTREEILKVAKPILFNTDMVRSTLKDRKSVTRRLVNFLPGKNPNWTGYVKDGLMLYNGRNEPCIRPPRYRQGDYLYVRETWQRAGLVDDSDQVIEGTEKYYYAAGPECPCFDFWVDPYTGEHKDHMPWHPSIHMPKEAARIFLRVTDVRVERLQDIMKDPPGPNNAVVKEGCIYGCDFIAVWENTIPKKDREKYGWDANP